ncbi:MAG TPA: hypothetical protein VM659_28745 [Dongiaceae bacterium]|nr:hypothetical protein [Dongiaceae bacterium]
MLRIVSWLWAPIHNPGLAFIFRIMVGSFFLDATWLALKIFVLGGR